MLIVTPLCSIRPSFFSTVLPGQLPVCWCKPVSALKMVVLPAFGLPASAMVSSVIPGSQQDHFDLVGFLLAQGQVIAFHQIFDRVAQRRLALDQDCLAFDNSHFDEPPAQGAGT